MNRNIKRITAGFLTAAMLSMGLVVAEEIEDAIILEEPAVEEAAQGDIIAHMEVEPEAAPAPEIDSMDEVVIEEQVLDTNNADILSEEFGMPAEKLCWIVGMDMEVFLTANTDVLRAAIIEALNAHYGLTFENGEDIAEVTAEEIGDAEEIPEIEIVDASIVESGVCGNNLSYTLDSNGILTISGTGNMYDYENANWSYEGAAPWMREHSGDVKELVVSAGVTSIGTYAFNFCRNLRKVSLPDGLKTIESNAFGSDEDYAPISSVTIPGSVTEFDFSYCEELECVTILSGVTAITDWAFSACHALRSVIIPTGVKTIGNDAFQGTRLETVTLPDGVTTIGNEAFSMCHRLREISIPDSVKSIGSLAFECCENMKTIEIPSSVTSIGEAAFFDIEGLTTIICESDSYARRYAEANGIKWQAIEIAPVITAQPKSVEVTAGTDAIFTVKASGNKLSYRWQYKTTESAAWANTSMVGYNTASLTVPATMTRNGYRYRCIVKNSAGSVNTETAILTVKNGVTITTQPASVTANVGTDAKFTVAAKGSDLTYRWQYRTSTSGTWANTSMAGYNTATLTVPAVMTRNGYQYRCIVKNSASSVNSNTATLTVRTVVTITTQPASVTTNAGTDAKFTVAAKGTGLTYRWQYKTSASGAWTNTSLGGYNTATLTVPALASRNGYKYRCIVKDNAGQSATSNEATLTVLSGVTITAQPASATVAKGATAKFTVVASGSGLTYRWQYRTNANGAWTNTSLSGYNTATLSVPAVATRNGYKYRCIVKDSAGRTATSEEATLTVE